MRPRSFALLMLAVGCGLVASIGISVALERRHREAPASSGAAQPVFVALTDIDQGEVLTPEVLKPEQWPKDKVPSGTLSRIQDIEGRRTRTKLYAGEPILENKLFPKGFNQQGATGLIPKGYRVVPVKVDLVSGGSSLILPGDRVDVMVHLVRNPSRDIPETVTRTILQDIKVFAVNDVIDIDNSKGGEKLAAKTISLLVTPEQAAKVMLASQLGTIQLVMRSPADQQNSPNAEARPGELFGTLDAGDRKKESASETPSLTEQVKGLRELFESMKNRPAATAATSEAEKPKTIWTVRILKPDNIEEVAFEEEAQKTAAAPWWSVWKETAAAVVGPTLPQETKPVGSNAGGGTEEAVQKLPPTSPTVPAEKNPQELPPAALEQASSTEGA